MSLKHRNIIAWILLLAAAISWSTGRSFSRLYENMDAPAATAPSTYWTEETVFPTNASGELDENETIFPTEPYHVLYELFPGLSAGMTRAVSLVLSFLTVIFAAIGIFFLSAGKANPWPGWKFSGTGSHQHQCTVFAETLKLWNLGIHPPFYGEYLSVSRLYARTLELVSDKICILLVFGKSDGKAYSQAPDRPSVYGGMACG